MIDSHLLDRMIETRVFNYTKCLQGEEGTVEALRIHDLHGVFYMYLVGILVSAAALVGELLRSALRGLSGRIFAKTVPWNVWAKCRIAHTSGQPNTSRRADNQTQQDPVPGISPLSTDHRSSYSVLQVKNSKTGSSHKALHPLNFSRLNTGEEEAADHGE
ncbi:hypothetical protein HPB47_027685 [Ixodes persulcatus]|uniref:Uncharacterized protein n=1 Tax=Ixodes persulcatus TaxID=34615 RepID=A0AC60PWG0_IXOPE|nr:hypothetical protein HPB47_027685 [Ixodes persulcatus]